MSVSDSTQPVTHRSNGCYDRLKYKINESTPVHESKDDVPDNQKAYTVVAREVTDNADPYGLLIAEIYNDSITSKCNNPDSLITRNLLAKVRVAPGDGT